MYRSRDRKEVMGRHRKHILTISNFFYLNLESSIKILPSLFWVFRQRHFLITGFVRRVTIPQRDLKMLFLGSHV